MFELEPLDASCRDTSHTLSESLTRRLDTFTPLTFFLVYHAKEMRGMVHFRTPCRSAAPLKAHIVPGRSSTRNASGDRYRGAVLYRSTNINISYQLILLCLSRWNGVSRLEMIDSAVWTEGQSCTVLEQSRLPLDLIAS